MHCNARVYPTLARHIGDVCHVCKRKPPNKVIPLWYPRYPQYPHKGYGFVGGNKSCTLTPTPHTPQQKPRGFQNPCHSLKVTLWCSALPKCSGIMHSSCPPLTTSLTALLTALQLVCYVFFLFALLHTDTSDCLLSSLPHPCTKGSCTFTTRSC